VSLSSTRSDSCQRLLSQGILCPVFSDLQAILSPKVPYSIYRECTIINNLLLIREKSDATSEIEENMFPN
jgi:hypothetical protein